MPGNRPSRQVPAWKKGVAQGKSETVAKHAWQREKEEAPQATNKWSLWSKRGLAVGGFVAALVVLVLVILWLLPPKPATLIVLGDDYVDDLALPHNLYGMNTARELEKLARGGETPVFWWGSGTLQLHQSLERPKPEASLGMNLGNVKARTLVIYLALHGGADGKGAYLFVADHKRIYIKDILEQLKHENLKDNRKLLILDPTQPTVSWPLGLMHNDFARELLKLEGDIANVPNLVVVCASDVGQRSWVSEEWRRSIFGHFVREALRGATLADNDRIKGDWFCKYVSSGVGDWVRENRGAKQTPLILPRENWEKLASDMELAVVKEKYAGANPAGAPGETFTAPETLNQAWARRQELAKLVPAPWVYAPHSWHRYLALLKRYEDLVRAGDDDSAKVAQAAIYEKINGLVTDLERARRLDLACMQNSVPMAAALGMDADGLSGNEMYQRFASLWEAPDAKKWADAKDWAKKIAPEGGERVLSLKFNQLLVEEIAKRPGKLQQACRLLMIVNDVGSTRPTEAHYAIMVRDVLSYLEKLDDPSKLWVSPMDPSKVNAAPQLLELVKKSLGVRLLAEKAALGVKLGADSNTRDVNGEGSGLVHPYSETVVRWIEDEIVEADAERRAGEDLLFMSDEASWAKAATNLAAAEKKYLDVGKIADRVRAACRTRDQILAELPYYSHWLALRQVFTVGGVDVEGLWKGVHQLVQLLEADPRLGKGTAAAREDGLRALDKLVEELRRNHTKVADEFRDYCKERLRDVILPVRLREMENTLVVPFIDAHDRLILLANIRKTSRTFNNDPGRREWPPAPDSEAQREAQAQARMALAALGERRINEKIERGSDFLDLSRKVARSNNWWEELTDVGDHVGRNYLELSREIHELVSKAKEGDLVNAAECLFKAERLSRQLEGSFADTDEAVASSRKLRVYRLLLEQMQRTYLDFWAREGRGGKTPYYRDAGKSYLDDSEKLLAPPLSGEENNPARTGPQSELAKRRGLLEPALLKLEGPARLDFTTEKQLDIHLAAQTKLVPPGTLVARVDTSGNDDADELLKLVAPPEGVRIALKLGDAAAQSLDCRLESPYLKKMAEKPGAAPAEPRSANMIVRAIYRGHRQEPEQTVAVRLHAAPDISRIEYQSPRKSGIAVRAADAIRAQKAAVTVVIDCSGSMNDRDMVSGKSRMKRVKEMLKEVLLEVPRGSRLSVWAFSGTHSRFNAQKEPEKTIEPLHKEGPVEWDPRLVNDADWWKPIEDLQADGYTPLARAMVKASNSDLKSFPGYKMLVVLTDGMDTCFENRKKEYYGRKANGELVIGFDTDGDPDVNRAVQRVTIGEFLQHEFANSDIDIRIMGFELEPEEKAFSEKQFKQAIKEGLKGEVDYITKLTDLKEKVGEAFRRLRLTFRLQYPTGQPVPRPGTDKVEYEISRAGDPLYWHELDAGRYEAIIQGQGKRYPQELVTRRGELLLATLTGERKFERVVYSKEDRFAREGRPFREDGNWRLAVLKNQFTKSESALMVVTLEEFKHTLAAGPDDTLRQVQPGFTWLEVRGPGPNSRAVPVRWGNVSGYPAPAFQLEALSWTFGAVPQLDAWWITDPVPEIRRTVKPQPGEYRTEDGARFTIENVSYDELTLETVPGRKPKVTGCLVVRGSYDADKPVLVQPIDLKRPTDKTLSQHLLFSEPGKYTGIFYPVTRDQVENSSFSLGFISIEAFKKTAQHATIGEREGLKAPSDSDNRLQPYELPPD
jgi:Mg-chelatase subunit ChlD